MATSETMRTVPDFINVGPGRCGTSWLHEALAAHPEIGMARVKETEFFNTNFALGYDWYREHFSGVVDRKAVGEVSNMYYLDTAIPERLLAYNPGIKVIFNIRDPLALMKSYFQFGVRRGLPFRYDATDLDVPVGLAMGSGYRYRESKGELTPSDTPTLIESVMLSRYLKPYVDQFPPEQLYIFDFERLRREPDQELRRIYAFLGVNPDFTPEAAGERVNEALRPKSGAIARLATATAFLLRRIGAYGLLTRLHGSRLLKAVLFRPVAPNEIDRVMSIPAEAEQLLAEERVRIAALHPDIAASWKQAGLV